MYSTMQPLMDMGCMRGVPGGTGFVELNRYIKKLMCAVPFHVWSNNFFMYRAFFPFTLMVVILALFLIRAIPNGHIRILTYIRFFIYNLFIMCLGWVGM